MCKTDQAVKGVNGINKNIVLVLLVGANNLAVKRWDTHSHQRPSR